MQFIQTERHVVIVTKTFDIDVNDVISKFGSVEKFKELYDVDDESAIEFVDSIPENYDSESEEDWISDRKGDFECDSELLFE